jgi:hypothetical protein
MGEFLRMHCPATFAKQSRDTSTTAHREENTRAATLTHTTVRTVMMFPRRKLKVTHVMATELRWWATEAVEREKASALHHHGVPASTDQGTQRFAIAGRKVLSSRGDCAHRSAV